MTIEIRDPKPTSKPEPLRAGGSSGANLNVFPAPTKILKIGSKLWQIIYMGLRLQHQSKFIDGLDSSGNTVFTLAPVIFRGKERVKDYCGDQWEKKRNSEGSSK